MKKVSVLDLDCNFIKLFKQDWALVTAGDKDTYNTMTVSWGSVGSLWGTEVAIVYVRKSRYTHDFMEKYDRFTVSFYPESHREALALCGRESGRDMDKVAASGLVPVFDEDGIYFEGAKLTLFCRTLYKEDFKGELMPPEVKRHYLDEDYHDVYIAEITGVLAE